jgi:hypothetical protein
MNSDQEDRSFLCKFSLAESPCDSTKESAYIICEICRSPVCDYHTSEADPTVCIGCFSDAALATQEDPLVSEDGVVHKGRVIIPLGFTYKTLSQRLIDYTEDELILHIHHVRAQIDEAQRVLDYRRIDMSASSVELEERQIGKRKQLRLQGVNSIANGSKTIQGPDQLPSAKEKALLAVATKLRTVATLLGLPCKTAEDLAKVALAVKAIGEAKAKQARVAKAVEVGKIPHSVNEEKEKVKNETVN